LAWPTWGVLCSLPVARCFPEPFNRLRKSNGLSWQRSCCLGISKYNLGRRRATCEWWCFGSHARHAVVAGHSQATFHSVSQCVSHRSGRVPSFPIRIERGKGELFALIPCPSLAVCFSLDGFLLLLLSLRGVSNCFWLLFPLPRACPRDHIHCPLQRGKSKYVASLFLICFPQSYKGVLMTCP